MEQPSGSLEFYAGGYQCRLAWSAAGIRRFSFRRTGPARRPGARQAAGSPPAFVRRARRELVTYFSGGRPDFAGLPLDLGNCGPFARSVYGAVRRIPYGRTLSYADVAAMAGNRKAARAVGMCMKKNPVPILVPCHRVIRQDGSAGGFTSPDGTGVKVKLLRMEGAYRQ